MSSDLRSAREPMRRFIAVLGCLLCLGQAIAEDNPNPGIYMAGIHDSAWNFSDTGPVCELVHAIPRFGHARFLRVAGETLVFRIDSNQPVPKATAAMLREVSPPWHHTAPDPLELQVDVTPGRHPISLESRPAQRLLASLAKGQIGSFDLPDWNDGSRQLHIRLSPVEFQQPYRAFMQCVGRHSSVGDADYRHTTVHFATNVHQLDNAARRTLTGLADYIKVLDGIKAVNISGYADDLGRRRYNLRLSAERAKGVVDFLIAQGVSPSLLTSRYYGESRPKVRARSKTARAANRRVEIELAR